MKHLEDDDLVLHYYGEGEASAASHLEECADCRGRFELVRTELGRVQDDVPEPDAGYEGRLWGRIRPGLKIAPIRRPSATISIPRSWSRRPRERARPRLS